MFFSAMGGLAQIPEKKITIIWLIGNLVQRKFGGNGLRGFRVAAYNLRVWAKKAPRRQSVQHRIKFRLTLTLVH